MVGDTGGDFIEYGHSENILGSLVGEHCLPSLGVTFFRWFLTYPAIQLKHSRRWLDRVEVEAGFVYNWKYFQS